MVNRTVKASWQALKYVLIFCIIQSLYGMMVRVSGTIVPRLVAGMERLPLEALMALSRYAVAPVVAFALCYQLFRDRHQRVQAASCFTRPSLKEGALALLGGLLMGGALLVSRSTLGIAGSAHQLVAHSQGLLHLALILLIARPLAQEILFRGFVLGELKQHLSDKKALVIQAVIYGLLQVPVLTLTPLHMYPLTTQISHGMVATAEGLVYGLATLWSGSLWVPVIMRLVSRIVGLLL